MGLVFNAGERQQTGEPVFLFQFIYLIKHVNKIFV